MKPYREVMAEVADFPFVAELPKREKSKIASLWDKIDEAREIIEKEGVLLPPSFVGKILNISRQRVYQLIDSGRFKVVDLGGHSMITENSILEWAKSERQVGRPVNPASARQIAMAGIQEMKKKY